MKDEELEWATPPLLDEKNIGKKVLHRWNGNERGETTMIINKIGRTNIHVGRWGRSDSYKVDSHPDGFASRKTSTGHIETVHTFRYAENGRMRSELLKAIGEKMDRRFLYEAPLDYLQKLLNFLTYGEAK